MIKNYRSFKSNLILEEIHIEYLSKFEEILQIMKSPISKFLLQEIPKMDLDIDLNNIGTTDINDMVGFSTVNKNPSKIIYYAKSAHIFPQEDVVKKMGVLMANSYNSLVDGEYVIEKELSSPETFSILRRYGYSIPNDNLVKVKNIKTGAEFITIKSELSKTNKTIPESKLQIKIGRIVNRIISKSDKKFTPKEMEEFVNEFKSTYEVIKDEFRNFELVEGEQIRHFYNQEYYSMDKKSTLQSSCMREERCSKYFEIYVQNPLVCKLLILKDKIDPTKITGRALVWTLIDNSIFMDRIYYSSDMEINLFISYAKKSGWSHKVIQGSGSGIIKNADDTIKNSQMSCQLRDFDFDYYPYLDTLKWLSSDGILSMRNSSSYDKELQGVHGDWVRTCEVCNGTGEIDCDECSGGEIRCSRCSGDGEIECRKCFGDKKIKCECKDNDSHSKCENCDEYGYIKCTRCEGSGDEECPDCNGDGHKDCEDCDGNGRLECYECQ